MMVQIFEVREKESYSYMVICRICGMVVSYETATKSTAKAIATRHLEARHIEFIELEKEEEV